MSGPDRNLETLVGGGAFFECPRWHDGRLWVSDYWRHQVLAIAGDGTTETVAQVPGSPSGLGWLPDGTLLVVSMLDRKLLRVENGATVVHADLSAHSGPQGNDMVVDAAGRAYVSTIDFEAFADLAATNLVRVDPDGSLANRRVWAGFAPPRATATPGQPVQWSCAPDGIALDAEGAVWVADAANKRALRVREGGELLEELRAGDLDVIACALGGDDGHTLFLCTTPDFQLPPEEAARMRPARILTCRVDVPHAGRP